MFTANTELQVTETDFDGLKNSFKTFAKNKTEFTDYNFEGSTLNQVLNILAYHAYQNSFYQNMAVNEAYLDTAQVRSNIVSNAKKLGYLPHSSRGATTSLQLTFNPLELPDSITVPTGTKFTALKDSVQYTFITREEHVISSTNGYVGEVRVYEGNPITQTFVYNTGRVFYEIGNKNIDLDSLVVQLKATEDSTEVTRLTQVLDLTDISAESNVYYLQENHNEKYELYFGDGVLGRQLENGMIIELEYQVSNGDEGNDIRSFVAVGYTGHSPDGSSQYVPMSIVATQATTDGFGKEGSESIRFNSKHYHSIQNRFVTSSDYLYFLKNEYSFIESIQVWGGEEHVPPIYGKVIISVKPKDGFVLSELTKDDMRATLKSRNVLTIEPIFIDPIYLYIRPTITVTYDSKKTTLDRSGIFDKIQTAVQNYESQNLSNFGEQFQYSRFTQGIDNADPSIQSSETTLLLEKRFAPIIDSILSYRIQFTNQVRNPFAGYQGAISSTGFKTNTSDQTQYMDDDGNGNIRFFYYDNSNAKTYLNTKAGTINYLSGEILIKGIKFVSYEGDYISVKAQPQFMNFEPLRNQILLLSFPMLTMIDTNTNQLVKSEILDVNGNITSVTSDSIDIPVQF